MKGVLTFITLFLFTLISCKKEPLELSAGFSASNIDTASQASRNIHYVKITLNAVADRDVYIKYLIEGSDLYYNILDTGYFVIKKGQQERSIPFTINDLNQREDIRLRFVIVKVYSALLDNSAKELEFTIKTDYLPTSGSGNMLRKGISYSSSEVNTNYYYEQTFSPQGSRYNLGMSFSNGYHIGFTFYRKPEEGRSYDLVDFGVQNGYDVVSSFTDEFYDVYRSLSGSITVTAMDTVNKTMAVSFMGIYQYDNDTITGNISFSRYNFE